MAQVAPPGDPPADMKQLQDCIARSATSSGVASLTMKYAGLSHSLYTTGDYSDLTIKCESREWKVHKVVICSQSAYLKAASKREWTAEDDVIKIDNSAEVVNAMIKFLYRGTYSDDWCKLPQAECGPMAFNLKMFSAADLYDIPGLGQLAKTKLLSRLEEMADVQDFRSTIILMYQDGELPFDSAAIRGKVIELAIREHCGSVDPVTGAVEDSAIDDLLEDFPVFGKDLLVAFVERFTLLREDAEKRQQSLEQRARVLTYERLQHEAEIELSLKELEKQRAEATRRQDESLQHFRDQTMELEKKGKSSEKKEADLVKRETSIEQREEVYTRWYSGGELFPKIECQKCGTIFVVIDEKTAIESLCCPLCETNREPERQSRWTKLKSLFSK